MRITGANFPHHIARAYGVRAAQPAAKVTRADPAQRVDAIAKISPAAATNRNSLSNLVAQVVPGSISFTEHGTAVPKAPARAFYTHPADANAAATGVALGRSIDVSG